MKICSVHVLWYENVYLKDDQDRCYSSEGTATTKELTFSLSLSLLYLICWRADLLLLYLHSVEEDSWQQHTKQCGVNDVEGVTPWRRRNAYSRTSYGYCTRRPPSFASASPPNRTGVL